MNNSRGSRRYNGIALEKYVDTRFDAVDAAVKSAKESMEHRLDGMNEFRSAMKDQAGKFVTRGELLATAVGLAAGLFALLQYIKCR
jgi:hypothetical protein